MTGDAGEHEQHDARGQPQIKIAAISGPNASTDCSAGGSFCGGTTNTMQNTPSALTTSHSVKYKPISTPAAPPLNLNAKSNRSMRPGNSKPPPTAITMRAI